MLAFLISWRDDNPLATANTNTEACLIHTLGVFFLNFIFIYYSLIFIRNLLDLLPIMARCHSSLTDFPRRTVGSGCRFNQQLSQCSPTSCGCSLGLVTVVGISSAEAIFYIKRGTPISP